MLLSALLLASRVVVQAQPITVPAGYQVFRSYSSGYDSALNYRWRRPIIVLVGPPELPEGNYPPIPETEIQHISFGVQQIISVPVGEVCNPQAPVYLEYGLTLESECVGQ